MSKFLVKSTFQYSTIPSGLYETWFIKNDFISISCTTSKTYNYLWEFVEFGGFYV